MGSNTSILAVAVVKGSAFNGNPTSSPALQPGRRIENNADH